MNYGKKFLYIMLSAAGMMIAITGICYKTGYFPGHSESSAWMVICVGAAITVMGLINLNKY
ncbi:MAG: hypothetical protein ACSW8G_03695 [Bacillota bacterium]